MSEMRVQRVCRDLVMRKTKLLPEPEQLLTGLGLGEQSEEAETKQESEAH